MRAHSQSSASLSGPGRVFTTLPLALAAGALALLQLHGHSLQRRRLFLRSHLTNIRARTHTLPAPEASHSSHLRFHALPSVGHTRTPQSLAARSTGTHAHPPRPSRANRPGPAAAGARKSHTPTRTKPTDTRNPLRIGKLPPPPNTRPAPRPAQEPPHASFLQ